MTEPVDKFSDPVVLDEPASEPEPPKEPTKEPPGRRRNRVSSASSSERSMSGSTVRKTRDVIASAIMTVAVLTAAVLALGAALAALGANPDNAIVSTVHDLADQLDGPFADLFTFKGEATKQLLVNWGIAAVVYLIVGRVLERLLRP